jgi:hypothetical protein
MKKKKKKTKKEVMCVYVTTFPSILTDNADGVAFRTQDNSLTYPSTTFLCLMA